jgi:hypothetical protein
MGRSDPAEQETTMFLRKMITAAIAALTLGTAVATPGKAQAMGYGFGGLGVAGLVSHLALGAARAEAAPRRAVIVEHRYVRKGNRLHYCGCVVRHVRVYP